MSEAATILKERGNTAFTSGDFQEAIRLFSQAIALAPTEHVLYSNRSGAYASAKQYEQAKKDAENCIQLNPKWAKGYARLGLALYFLRDLNGARDAYAKGLALDPTNQAMKDGISKVEGELPKKRPASPADDSEEPTAKRAYLAEKPVSAMNKAELLVAISEEARPFKDKNEIVKRLNVFPAIKREEGDGVVVLNDLSIKQLKSPVAFHCFRCDKAKISTMRGSYKMKTGDKPVCHSCYDHLVRCVIPNRDLPAYQRPEKCVHQVPRGYQKVYR